MILRVVILCLLASGVKAEPPLWDIDARKDFPFRDIIRFQESSKGNWAEVFYYNSMSSVDNKKDYTWKYENFRVEIDQNGIEDLEVLRVIPLNCYLEADPKWISVKDNTEVTVQIIEKDCMEESS